MKPKKEIRLHTYGIIETEDFYFMSEQRAIDYAEKWLQSNRIKGYKIYSPSGKILKKEGIFKCMDWDKVNKYYESLEKAERKNK